jgi:cell division septal protein FtsQ
VKTAVDPRIHARRTQVRETWARRRLRWIVALVAIVIGAGIGFALLQSPWLAVRNVRVFGAVNSPVADILSDHHIVEGVPTVSVRPAAIEDALERDPWVAIADVRVTWPGTVEATVVERVPAGWIETTAGWMLVSADGVAVAAGAPTAGEPVVEAPIGPLGLGDTIADEDVVAAFEFLALLTPELAVDARVRTTSMGLEATLSEHPVLLGNRRDMEAKAATLAAMLEAGVPEGATVNVVSPLRPAVSNPQPLIESTGEDVSSSDDSG